MHICFNITNQSYYSLHETSPCCTSDNKIIFIQCPSHTTILLLLHRQLELELKSVAHKTILMFVVCNRHWKYTIKILLWHL